MSEQKKLEPFGEIKESFKGLKDEGIYYVDKTGIIPYLIAQKRKICVVTRPRRFGKTLMLRTLQTFFEYALDKDGKPVDNRRYFEGLKVMDSGEAVLKEMGQYPVISVSLKDVSGNTYDTVLTMLSKAVYDACQAHLAILLDNPALLEDEREQFRKYIGKKATEGELKCFLGDMCVWLKRITKRDIVILLDEYDVPIQKAAIHDLHNPGDKLLDDTISLIGGFISSGFKSNDYLAYGIIAGCMRVAKESIFTGMNNPGVITVVDEIPDEYWGFTHEEVAQMLAYYGLSDKMDALKYWYDGYLYSGREVFNPWSLLNAIRGLVYGYGDKAIQSYWAMTSSNDIIDEMIENNPEYREELARLLQGETKWIHIYKDLSYRDLKLRPDAIWSFLLYTGYLKPVEIKKDDDDLWIANVAVPNKEIATVMKSALRHWWMDICLPGISVQTLIKAFWNKDIDVIESEFINILLDGISAFDYKEEYYHGMVMGLLRSICLPKSNDEHGEGRPDIVAIIDRKALILEIKCVTPKMLKEANAEDDRQKIEAMMTAKLDEAEHQVDMRKYTDGIAIHYPIAKEIYCYALCFCRKLCRARIIS